MQYKHNTLVIPLQRNQLTNRKIMDELTDIYKRIEYLRNNGVKMKEIADRVDMARVCCLLCIRVCFPLISTY